MGSCDTRARRSPGRFSAATVRIASGGQAAPSGFQLRFRWMPFVVSKARRDRGHLRVLAAIRSSFGLARSAVRAAGGSRQSIPASSSSWVVRSTMPFRSSRRLISTPPHGSVGSRSRMASTHRKTNPTGTRFSNDADEPLELSPPSHCPGRTSGARSACGAGPCTIAPCSRHPRPARHP